MKERTLFARVAKTLTFLLLLTTFLASSLDIMVSGITYEEGSTYVHINELPYGNWTFTRKPVEPMRINASQIQIGANWTYVYTLSANHTYHVYCYGSWINTGDSPKTDYDIYVYNPLGELEGYHTEAAGLPEHLGSAVDMPFFTPKYSGNYSFAVRNDPRESQGAEAATFMVIEHVEMNAWHTRWIEGKQSDKAVENTSWAYGFATNSERVEIKVQVPDTLDMYEARLYLMANPSNKKGEFLNSALLAWEQGLYGEVSGVFGGYNLDSRGFRGDAYASCEFFGQDMMINFTAPYKGVSLYHLVLIGEYGSGNVSFRIKTNFGDSELSLLSPLQRVNPNEQTIVTVVSNNSNIQQAFLSYSVDNWRNSTLYEMWVSNRTCNASIPGHTAGITVDYCVEAFDFLDNKLSFNGSYTVKYPTLVNFTFNKNTITIGENISIAGFVRPASGPINSRVKLTFMSSNGSKAEKYGFVEDGNFTVSFKPPYLGIWSVQAIFMGDQERYDSFSDTFSFIVVEPSFLSKYSMYIFAGVGVAVGAVAVIIMLRRRQ